MMSLHAGRKRLKTVTMLIVVASAILLAVFSPAYAVTGEEGHGGEGNAVAQDEGHGTAEEAHAAPPKGWTKNDWARVLNFVILAGALFLVARKPVSQMLNARIAGIKEQLRELEEKKLEAEKELAEYNEKLTQLGLESEKIIDEYIRQGQEAKDRILKEAQSSAEKLEEKARKNIEHEFSRAKLSLQAEIIEKALAKAEANIISKISSEDQNRLVDEYLEKVVA